ncbi:hypothetical protein KBZ10_22545 [Streptomyces sp. F63]|uniref:hypothetical protein n=1 Tax=Streptomyces sp. F63 TaxID=2824887 RepID=UPI001B396BEF|nr:hypothetical protein [Streptomyces sp. F63]MBQ0987247.1 hypothetical protein [Streptomyces sp. F63]
MKRINLRDVPDETYQTLVRCAEANRQSLNAFVVDQLEDLAKTANLTTFLDLYEPPAGTGISIEDAVDAVRAAREKE